MKKEKSPSKIDNNARLPKETKKKSPLREAIETIVWSLVIALLIIQFVVQSFYIPSSSMEPTLVPGERVLVAKFYYRITEPQRGDIIVFRYPIDNRKNLIKRVIGLPGEKIKISNGMIYVNGEPLQGDKFGRTYYDYGFYGEGEKTVPEDSYFVLGDNSLNSDDSRFWGYVPRKNILGRAFLIYWPLTHITLLK
ncbi:MAG: signal peptidase I [Candidatus Atribacteria bacterium]|nr:signal peptidase I [Candidatus Atribacteria bacterium]